MVGEVGFDVFIRASGSELFTILRFIVFNMKDDKRIIKFIDSILNETNLNMSIDKKLCYVDYKIWFKSTPVHGFYVMDIISSGFIWLVKKI